MYHMPLNVHTYKRCIMYAHAVIHKIFALPYTAAWLHLYVTMVTQHHTVFVKKLWTDDPVAYHHGDTIFMDR